MVEVEEDELGIPVTASYHVRVPLRHNAVFEVNIHAEMQGMQVIMGMTILMTVREKLKPPIADQHTMPMPPPTTSAPFSENATPPPALMDTNQQTLSDNRG